jgi:hypothetical protein
MEDLANLLRMLEASELPDNDAEDYYLQQCDHPLVSEIEAVANDLLISGTGNPNFEVIDELYRDYGYFIFPGERDSFGWLTGCLQTKKGIIVFG